MNLQQPSWRYEVNRFGFVDRPRLQYGAVSAPVYGIAAGADLPGF